ncbi:metallothionein-like protein type 2 [Tripterygium wilfordii]|uniref:metallothionein-like protein type 2 n=1 Tax=Tripterygium wilfordii TaxID=458696 RepID=UPI0018F857C6|nr:metallothionein-like protein type 2 [Tripterygium wilfordii]
MSSCCGGNCRCGSACKCANGSEGSKMYPDLSSVEKSTTETVVLGVAPEKPQSEGSEMGVRVESGCKCNPCKCNPCNC